MERRRHHIGNRVDELIKRAELGDMGVLEELSQYGVTIDSFMNGSGGKHSGTPLPPKETGTPRKKT